MPTESTGEQLSQERLGRLFGLAMVCPAGQDNPPDCPLYAIRQKPIAERLAWARSLSRDEADKILIYHTCSCPRMRTKP